MRTDQYRSGEVGLELLELLGLLWLHRSQEKLVESGGRGCMCNTSRAVFNKLLLGSVCVRACVFNCIRPAQGESSRDYWR